MDEVLWRVPVIGFSSKSRRVIRTLFNFSSMKMRYHPQNAKLCAQAHQIWPITSSRRWICDRRRPMFGEWMTKPRQRQSHPSTRSWLWNDTDQLLDKILILWMILCPHGWIVVIISRDQLLIQEQKGYRNLVQFFIYGDAISSAKSQIMCTSSSNMTDNQLEEVDMWSTWTNVRGDFWAQSVNILVFPSPISYVLSPFGSSFLIWGIFSKYLWNDGSFSWSLGSWTGYFSNWTGPSATSSRSDRFSGN